MYIPPSNDSYPYKVSVAHFETLGTVASDPLTYRPTSAREPIQMSLFLPVPKADCVAECGKLYMPADIACSAEKLFFKECKNVFSRIRYKYCCSSHKAIDAINFPLVFMEPQAGISRFLYTTLARYISANGMAVVLIDHRNVTHWDSFTDFPIWGDMTVNRTVEHPEPGLPTDEYAELYRRGIDIFMVVTALQDISLLSRHFPAFNFNTPIGTNRFGIVGHGVGGSVGTQIAAFSHRCHTSINLSGAAPKVSNPASCMDHVATPGTIYFFGRSDYNRDTNVVWEATLEAWGNKAVEYDLQSAGLFDYSDLPLIVDLARKNAGIEIKGVNGLRDTLGPLGFHVTACYVEAILKNELIQPGNYVEECQSMFYQMQPHSVGNSTLCNSSSHPHQRKID
ncbi:hypothetical protein G6514_007059 [Epicoccum nigrum]|nr:hypothetical protein G6514_007059 [Epicoccum nigrum]